MRKDLEEKIMNNIEVKKIVQTDDNTLNTITE